MSDVNETCSCGASISATGRRSAETVAKWRRTHRCTKVPPGICGDRNDENLTGQPLTCDLLYGHKGWHRRSDGVTATHWAWVLKETR